MNKGQHKKNDTVEVTSLSYDDFRTSSMSFRGFLISYECSYSHLCYFYKNIRILTNYNGKTVKLLNANTCQILTCRIVLFEKTNIGLKYDK